MKFLDAKEKGRLTIVGVPFDGTTCFRPGTRFGPDGIRMFSHNLETYSPLLDKSLEDIDYKDAGNLELSAVPERAVNEIYEFFKNIEVPVVLGGEHSISYPIIKALKERFSSLTVVHFDAHADLRDSYSGTKFSHACVMRRVLELGCNIIQVGIRSGTKEEFQLINENERISLITIKELSQKLKEVDNPIYFSIDIDYFDPAFAPGTGTPEPCGGNPLEFFNIIYNLPPVNVIGFDVVEVSPPYDLSGITQMLAAKVVRELMLKFWGG